MIRRIKLEKTNFVVAVVEKQLILHLRFKAVVYTYFISSYVFVLFLEEKLNLYTFVFAIF